MIAKKLWLIQRFLKVSDGTITDEEIELLEPPLKSPTSIATTPDYRAISAGFSAMNMGDEETEKLYADLVLFANNCSRTYWSSDVFQVEICGCGEPGCADAGWLTIRNAGALIVFLPNFPKLITDNPYRAFYHGPPSYVAFEGIPAVIPETYIQLRKLDSAPDLNRLARLTACEALRLIQILSPCFSKTYRGEGWSRSLLGDFPEPIAFDKSKILAVSHGELDDALDLLDTILRLQSDTQRTAQIRELKADDQVLTFFLDASSCSIDTPSLPEWPCLVVRDSNVGLLLTDDYWVDFGTIG